MVLVPMYFLLLFLAIFWLLVLFSAEDRKQKKTLKRYPFFSVLVPAYNEQEGIVETLHSLIRLDYPRQKLEVLVINDGSTDRTPQYVEEFIAAHPEHNIVLLNQKNQGKGKALNTGLARARGEFFACLDADSAVSSDALQMILPLFEKDVAAVCPLLKVKNPHSIILKVQWYEYVINMFYKWLNAKVNSIHVTPGPFSVYRTVVIKSLGGYDEHTITEDLEIAIRLQKHHYRILQTFDTTVETASPTTWRELFWQRVRWYKGSLDNTLRYRSLIFNKKYGDFGMLRMPTILTAGVFAIILTGAVLQDLGSKAWKVFLTLKDVNFDLLTLLREYTFAVNLLNLPFFKLTIACTLLAISIFVMIYSFRVIEERISHYGRTWISLFTYLAIYSLFLTTVWLYISYLVVKKKRDAW